MVTLGVRIVRAPFRTRGASAPCLLERLQCAVLLGILECAGQNNKIIVEPGRRFIDM